MWYYESLANQWPAPPWATDSQRFATCNVIMVQFLHCTIINLEPIQKKISVPDLLFTVRLGFAIPTNRCDQWPKEAQATDWPTIRSTTELTNREIADKSAIVLHQVQLLANGVEGCRDGRCQTAERSSQKARRRKTRSRRPRSAARGRRLSR